MHSRIVALALVASAALLAGCTQASTMPEPPSEREVSELLDHQNAEWWKSMFPDEPRPQVDVVEYIDPMSESSAVPDCIVAANVPGVTIADGAWGFTASSPETEAEFNRALYVCSSKYPYAPLTAEDLGIMSTDQLEYLYAYFTERLLPCMALMGYDVATPPSHDSFIFSAPYLSWDPYQVMIPQPRTAREWQRVDARCPPPSVGTFWREGIG